MSVVNSSANNNDDDGLTMINQSMIFDGSNDASNDSVIRRLQQVHRGRTTNPSSDYVYVEHDRLESAQEIERILILYRQDLKQESNNQHTCNSKLITRLIDAIRPVYSSNDKQMRELHNLFEEISDLQDIRFIEQKEKLENLTNEIAHLKKLILGTTKQAEENPNPNTMAKAYQINSMVNYEQWQQLEDETKHLQNLVETQRTKINELVQLLSNGDNPSVATERPPATDDRRAITVQNLRTFSRLPSSSQTQATCPICNHKFPSLSSDIDIDNHIDECLSSTFKQYQCPRCQRNFPIDDKDYIQHLTDCLNRNYEQIKHSKIRICPLCQAIFSVTSMNDRQYQQHIEAHN